MKVICSAFMIFVCNIPSSIEDIWCKGKKKKKKETEFHNKIQSGKSSLVCWDIFGFLVVWILPPGSGGSWWGPRLWVISQEGSCWFLQFMFGVFYSRASSSSGEGLCAQKKEALEDDFCNQDSIWWPVNHILGGTHPSTLEEPSCGRRPLRVFFKD